jgi:transposase IS66-like protein
VWLASPPESNPRPNPLYESKAGPSVDSGIAAPPAARAGGLCRPAHAAAALHKLGEDVTESLELVPRQWKVIQHVREKYSCRSCETITQPPAPSHPIARGRAGPGCWRTCCSARTGCICPAMRPLATGRRNWTFRSLGSPMSSRASRIPATASIPASAAPRSWRVGSDRAAETEGSGRVTLGGKPGSRRNSRGHGSRCPRVLDDPRTWPQRRCNDAFIVLSTGASTAASTSPKYHPGPGTNRQLCLRSLAPYRLGER